MTGSGRYRPEATAQSKAIRALSSIKGESLQPGQTGAAANQVMWEAALNPDGTYAPDWQNPNDPIPDPPSPGCRFDILVDDPNQSIPPSIVEVRAYSGTAKTDLDTLITGRYTTCAKSWGLPVETNGVIRRDPTLGAWVSPLGQVGWSMAYLDNLNNVWCVWAETDPAFYGQAYFAPQPLTPVDIQMKTPGCHGDLQDVPGRYPDDDQKAAVTVAGQANLVPATVSAAPGTRVMVAGTGLIANKVYVVKFADGADLANDVPCYKAVTIGGPVTADSTGTIASTPGWLPPWAQPNSNGQLCFVDSPTVDNASAAATIAVRSLSEVTVIATSGGSQSSIVGNPYPAPLTATARDASGNPVRQLPVTFTAPSSGATASFAPLDPDATAGTAITVLTDDTGLATSSAFTAGATTGSYQIIASASGTTSTASFAATNSPATC